MGPISTFTSFSYKYFPGSGGPTSGNFATAVNIQDSEYYSPPASVSNASNGSLQFFSGTPQFQIGNSAPAVRGIFYFGNSM